MIDCDRHRQLYLRNDETGRKKARKSLTEQADWMIKLSIRFDTTSWKQVFLKRFKVSFHGNK